ncbi:hypothetical protein ElyMa_001484200 [Elysia marginata]|uniref:Hypervirulence associated protein TUDOR domain-containing protein n=1 Tax=Elysia marginata TaxID=1093978 RepID=A0AAV4J290_9GAST|nr:hypothetical protein ElyMa_001484200 [Elysia marginata]
MNAYIRDEFLGRVQGTLILLLSCAPFQALPPLILLKKCINYGELFRYTPALWPSGKDTRSEIGSGRGSPETLSKSPNLEQVQQSRKDAVRVRGQARPSIRTEALSSRIPPDTVMIADRGGETTGQVGWVERVEWESVIGREKSHSARPLITDKAELHGISDVIRETEAKIRWTEEGKG